MSRVVVAFFSDLHSGSVVGLQQDKVKLHDGQTILSSPAQQWLWQCWLDFWDQVFEIADDDPVIAVANGDLVDGVHHATTQLVSDRWDDHERIAVSALDVFANKVDSTYIVRGTPAHVAEGAQSEERIARTINAVPETDSRYTHYDLWLEVEGVRFHVAHHRGGSHRPWTKGNPMRTAVNKMIYHCVEAEMPIPHVVVRSHMHKFEDTFTLSRVCRGLALGAFQLKTEYVYRVEQEDLLSDVGGYAVACHDGEYNVHQIKFHPAQEVRPAYTKWTNKP